MNDVIRHTWRPTTSHVRSVAGGGAIATAALLLRRPDLLVLSSPLLIVGMWGALTRPHAQPRVSERLAHTALREGEATTWVASVERVDGVEDMAAAVAVPEWAETRPETGTVAAAATGAVSESSDLVLAIRSTRWGARLIGPSIVAATSAWGAFRWTSAGGPRVLTTLPQPGVFDSATTNPRPSGLVGLHRSARPGDGAEFVDIRPFQVGDRLRRIHWPTSLRTGDLHVTSTWADRDTQIALLVDAFNDLGPSDGVDGRASSLDITVRAAGAIAEYSLHHGDRVGLRILGAAGVTRVRAAGGRAHLRRLLDILAAIEPATNWRDEADPPHESVSAGVLVVMLSPLVSPITLARAVSLARHGLSVVVVDTLPPDVAADEHDPPGILAWRIRLLEREREIRLVQEAGVPVVAWQGPGSLDQVLRDLRRRAAAPRVVIR